jgi:hypothetical protein
VEDVSTRIRAQEVICACPRIFTRRMIVGESQTPSRDLDAFQYSPWLVANLSLKALPPARPGAPLAWDNVIYDSPSLGYVLATHQSLATHVRNGLNLLLCDGRSPSGSGKDPPTAHALAGLG